MALWREKMVRPTQRCKSLRRIVLVSGPPASGKTTLARPLAGMLGFALLSKDDIKEALFTALQGPPGDLEFSRRMSAAAMEILWSLARRCPQVVLEANFRTRSESERALVAALGGPMVEVCCRISPEEASRRFAERAVREGHHPAHALREMAPEKMAEFEGPFGLSAVIEVDTSQSVNISELARHVSALLAAQSARADQNPDAAI